MLADVFQTYREVTQQSIDELWELESDLVPKPKWTAWYIRHVEEFSDLSSSEDEAKTAKRQVEDEEKKKTALVRRKPKVKKGGGGHSSHKQITDGNEDDDLPALVSASSDDDDGEPSDEPVDSDLESEWDKDERALFERLCEDAIKEMAEQETASSKIRKAWRVEDEEEEDENPFLRLMHNLRGRLFSTDPTYRPTKIGTATSQRRAPIIGTFTPMPNRAMKLPVQFGIASGAKPKKDDEGDLPPLGKSPKLSTTGGTVTVEDADDEEEGENSLYKPCAHPFTYLNTFRGPEKEKEEKETKETRYFASTNDTSTLSSNGITFIQSQSHQNRKQCHSSLDWSVRCLYYLFATRISSIRSIVPSDPRSESQS